MKILAFSDLHGEEAALEALKRQAKKYDYVFACGDISRNVFFAEGFKKALPDALVIPGNWDSEVANDVLSTAPHWLHRKREELSDGLNAVGFGFSPPTPFRTFGELGEDKILAQMTDLPIDANTLLMLHCPPRGHFDVGMLGRHIGSESILKIIREKQPLAAFFGHAHEVMGTAKLGTTTLVKLPPANAMRACSLDIRDKNITAEFITMR